jgi:hypothetical protein
MMPVEPEEESTTASENEGYSSGEELSSGSEMQQSWSPLTYSSPMAPMQQAVSYIAQQPVVQPVMQPAGSWTTQYNPATGSFVPVFVPNVFAVEAAPVHSSRAEVVEVAIEEAPLEEAPVCKPVAEDANKKSKKSKKSKDKKAPVEAPVGFRVFVGGLNDQTTSEGLREHFSKFGSLLSCNVVMDKGLKKNRGFGYVEYEHDVVDSLLEVVHVIDEVECGVRRFSWATTA